MEEATIDRPADGVARVTINRPEARNALSMAVRERVAMLFNELAVERKPQYKGA
jgi:enoyl-CoA hydratase/carnithine racemase